DARRPPAPPARVVPRHTPAASPAGGTAFRPRPPPPAPASTPAVAPGTAEPWIQRTLARQPPASSRPGTPKVARRTAAAPGRAVGSSTPAPHAGCDAGAPRLAACWTAARIAATPVPASAQG